MLHLYLPHHCAGAEVMVHAMLKELVDHGHEVHVQLSRRHAEITAPYEHEGVIVWPLTGKGDPLSFLHGDRYADLIVTHLENTHRATYLGQMYHRPVVHVLHNTFAESRHTLALGPALAVYNSQWARADYEAWWSENHTGIMPPGIVISPPVDREAYRVRPGDRITLINLSEGKGAKTFYSLAERMPERRFLGVRGAYHEQLTRDDLSNVEVVDHMPAADMARNVYSRTRVLLAPSSYESYGRVAMEACCAGIPVVAHPTPGLLECLGDAGTFADRDDIDAWAKALSRLGTPKGWAAASKKASARADQLTTTADLTAWREAAERTAARGVPR